MFVIVHKGTLDKVAALLHVSTTEVSVAFTEPVLSMVPILLIVIVVMDMEDPIVHNLHVTTTERFVLEMVFV